VNVFALTSLLASVATVFLGNFVLYRNPKRDLNRIFFLYCLSGAYWTFVEFAYRQADGFDTALFWMKVDVFRPFAISLLLHFTLAFTERAELLENRMTLLAIYIPALVFSLLDLTTDLVTGPPVRMYWGWTHSIPEDTPVPDILAIWSTAMGFLAVYLCLRHYLGGTGYQRRQRAACVLTGIFLPTITGFLTEGVLPGLGIRVPELTSIGFLLGSLFMGYAVWRYMLFALSPATAAENIISTMADALILADPGGNLVTVNQAALDLLGYKEQELIGQPVEAIFAEGTELTVAASAHDIEAFLRTKDAGEVPVSLRGSVVRDADGIGRGIVYVARDLTLRKREEEQRERLIAELEAKNRELDSFVYNVSHDLRSPLISVQGFSARLLEHYGGQLDGRGRLYLERIQANAEHMAQLISDLLELSRIGRVVGPPEDVPLREMVDQLVQEMEPRLEDRWVEIEIAPDLPIVRGDRRRLEQVMANLLSNAVKFMGQQPRPRVEVGWYDAGDAHVIYVRDNGIGIDPRHHHRIFEIFQRLEEVETEGTGVGLAIVKRIVEHHGGRIWVESQQGQGATFYFSLPRQDA